MLSDIAPSAKPPCQSVISAFHSYFVHATSSRFQSEYATHKQLREELPPAIWNAIGHNRDLYIIRIKGTPEEHTFKPDQTRLIEAYKQHGKDGLRHFRHEVSDRRVVR